MFEQFIAAAPFSRRMTWAAEKLGRFRTTERTALQAYGLVGVLAIGAALPIVIFRIPLLADYPNHLARIYTILSLDHDPLLARYYAADWRLLPNLAFDAAMMALARVFGIFYAGKIFLLVIAAMLPAGTIMLHRALHRRASLWPLVSFLFIYNQDFAYGLLNYLFSTGLALFAAALWIRQREAPPLRRAALSFVFIVAMFFSHFLGVGLYGMAIGCYELERWWRTRPAAAVLASDLAVLLVPFLLALPLTLASPTVGFASQTGWRFDEKALGLYFAFKLYTRSSAFVFAAVAGGALLWGLASGRLRVHRVGLVYAALAALVYLAMPNTLMSAALVDLRLPATFVLFLIAFSDWQPRSAREARRFAAALAALLAVVVTAVIATWTHYSRIIAQYEQSFAFIEPGSRVLTTLNAAGTDRTDIALQLHIPALVMIERSALYSNAFTHPAQQPLVLKAPYRAAAPYDGLGLPVEELAAADQNHPGTWLARRGAARPIYWSQWRRDYDYLYVLFTPEGYEPPLQNLTLLDRTPYFALYRIDHPGD